MITSNCWQEWIVSNSATASFRFVSPPYCPRQQKCIIYMYSASCILENSVALDFQWYTLIPFFYAGRFRVNYLRLTVCHVKHIDLSPSSQKRGYDVTLRWTDNYDVNNARFLVGFRRRLLSFLWVSWYNFSKVHGSGTFANYHLLTRGLLLQTDLLEISSKSFWFFNFKVWEPIFKNVSSKFCKKHTKYFIFINK